MNVHNSSIKIGNRVDGAIHVTSCKSTDIHGASHQLRIHESSDLEFHVCVDTGPILEESTNICFFKRSKGNALLEAKDFDWFRDDKPSPNFRIVEGTFHSNEDAIKNSIENVDCFGQTFRGTADDSDDDEL